MRTIADAYAGYSIMPALQLHQLRVAAVARMICDHLAESIDAHPIVLACLLHDMGNIIKSDLHTFPEFSEPEGVAHWQLVKDDFIFRFGTDEHRASIAIARELGVPDEVVRLIDGVGFSNLEHTRDHASPEQKIVEYADLRVGPHGVLSLEGRVYEARERYLRNPHPDMPTDSTRHAELFAAARAIEADIFASALISPGDITEEAVRPIAEGLRSYPLV